MSYQIKATPYFRRLVITSKKNGQLQRLKEQYDRMRDFSERTIEMKMRQVRLNRLFREIEEINESAHSLAMRRRCLMNVKRKTADDLRREAINRAKELGKEYSKMNAYLSGPSRYYAPVQSCVPSVSLAKQNLEQRKLREKRITYGNQISRLNLQRIVQTTQRKLSPRPWLGYDHKSMTELKKEVRKQRLNYGNIRSSMNMRPAHAITSTAKIKKRDSKYTEIPDSAGVTMVEKMQESDARARRRAQENWRRVMKNFRNRLEELKRQEVGALLNPDEEYQLRTISNVTNLQSSIYSLKSNSTDTIQTDDDEVLINSQILFDNDAQLKSHRRPTATAYKVVKARATDTVTGMGAVPKVGPAMRKLKKKDLSDTKVSTIRGIFEHQTPR